jgi:hypothetical protein
MTFELSEPDATLVDRVRKLLDKSARTDNQHEADVFARKAAELVARYRIDPERLAAGSESDDLTLIEIVVGRGAYVRGRIALMQGVADTHDVRMVFKSTPTGSVVMLAGRRDDLAILEVMYTSLHQQVATQMAAIRKNTGASTQRHRRAFLFGFADRIGELLAETRSTIEATEQSTPQHGAATAVVLQERSERLDQFASKKWGRVRNASQPARVVADGFANGVSAANRADVGRTRLGGRNAIGSGG